MCTKTWDGKCSPRITLRLFFFFDLVNRAKIDLISVVIVAKFEDGSVILSHGIAP